MAVGCMNQYPKRDTACSGVDPTASRLQRSGSSRTVKQWLEPASSLDAPRGVESHDCPAVSGRDVRDMIQRRYAVAAALPARIDLANTAQIRMVKGPNDPAKRAPRREATRHPTAGPLLGAPLEPMVMPPHHSAAPSPEIRELQGDTSTPAPALWRAQHQHARGRSQWRR